MSSADRTGGRRAARTVLATAALALVAGLSGCASEADAGPVAAPATTPAVAADDTTRGLAEIEFDRQCEIASMSFADEAGITAHLDDRLTAAGFTHEQWKQWHDALVHSPDLVTQFTEVAADGCPPA